jgi:hypothetical protein
MSLFDKFDNKNYRLEDSLFLESLEEAKNDGAIINYYDYFYQPDVPGASSPICTPQFDKIKNDVIKIYQITVPYSATLWAKIEKLKSMLETDYHHITFVQEEIEKTDRILLCALIDNDFPSVDKIKKAKEDNSKIKLDELRRQIRSSLNDLLYNNHISISHKWLNFLSKKDILPLLEELREKGYFYHWGTDHLNNKTLHISLDKPGIKQIKLSLLHYIMIAFILISALWHLIRI